MNYKCCSAEDIFHLNNSKEYVLLAQHILELVITDQRLTAQAAKLWQFLYSKAKFDNELAITTTYSNLAEMLGKSTRTIARYIASLEQFGYLQIHSNFNTANGSRLANTLFVRIPFNALEELKNKQDRKRNQEGQTSFSFSNDKIVIRSPDNNDILNINNNTINNNNNVINCVEDIDSSTDLLFHVEQGNQESFPDTQLAEIENDIHKLNDQSKILSEQFKAASTKTEQAALFSKLIALESSRDSLKLHYQNKSAYLNKVRDQASHKQNLLINDDYYLQKQGQRTFNKFEINRIKQRLKVLCTQENLPRLLNEITYAIRFGELQREQGTGRELEIQHGISIALKLVREGRWKTPKGLQAILD